MIFLQMVTDRHYPVVERQFQVVERQIQVAERRSGPFRLNLTTESAARQYGQLSIASATVLASCFFYV